MIDDAEIEIVTRNANPRMRQRLCLPAAGAEAQHGEITGAATQIGNDTVSIASKAGDIALTVGSTVGSAASTVLDGVEDAAGTAASYATMGLSAGQKIVSAWI